jgi:hypothetical protein
MRRMIPEIRMGDYFDLVADHFGLPRVPRLSRDEAQGAALGPAMSFMSESRRLLNQRIKKELRVRLHYPRVEDGMAAAANGHDRKEKRVLVARFCICGWWSAGSPACSTCRVFSSTWRWSSLGSIAERKRLLTDG